MCDTLVRVQPGRVLFGKNSDRDANEGQLLEWHAAAEHPAGAEVRCTHLSIPQARRTAAVLISRPYWMWGAEMGANEHGVVIGNEAVFTRSPVPRVGLLGMDLLRLALERSVSAAQAVEVLRGLLAEHGQGGGAGHEDRSFRYHNSFLVADPTGAVVVETEGRDSAVEVVSSGVRSISNALTIPGFGRPDPVRTWAAAARRRRACTMAARPDSAGDVMDVLRDHGPDGPRYSWLNGTLGVPCMHGGGLVASSVTTASWVSELTADGVRHWATACAAPDVALYKPVRVGEPLELGPSPGGTADDSRWWRQERLHRAWLTDPRRLGARFLPELREVQARWLADPPEPAEAFAEEDALLPRWIAAVEAARGRDVRPWHARYAWRRRERWARHSIASPKLA